MRANTNTYEDVAQRCSAFVAKQDSNTFSNSTSEKTVSCTNCKHFSQEKYCELDLYDQIVVNHNIK